MQTAAAASVTSATDSSARASGPFAPALRGSYAKALDRPRGCPALPDDEWDDNATEEEKFIALKAAVQEGLDDIDAGRVIEVPADKLESFIHELGERAAARVQTRREMPQYARAS